MPEGTTRTIVRSRTKAFKDIYVAHVLKNTATEYQTDTPVKLARAIKGKINEKWSTEKIYSDDTVEDTAMSYEGTEVELEVNSLAPQDKAYVFGQLYENGFLVKKKTDVAPEVAIGYRAKKLNGKYEFTWLYVGVFGQGYEDDYETEAEKATTQTATLKGDFYERQIDAAYQIQVDESNLIDADTDAATAIANWFGEVQEAPKGTEGAGDDDTQ